MERESIQIANLIDMDSPEDVFEEVKHIIPPICEEWNEKDLEGLEGVFRDVVRLFRGGYPGYRGCNTAYHDLKHTTDCMIAMARLMHGAFIDGVRFCKGSIILGIISALMHDTGYIQTEDDVAGTGARYTLVHIDRSIDFMRRYFMRNGYSGEDFRVCSACLKCTGLETSIRAIPFESKEAEILGKMLGSADILGQMADRTYIEKLVLLYHEFREGNVPGFESELDLLEKTPEFYEYISERLRTELGDVSRHMGAHFRVRWNMDRDLYAETIERHIEYIRYIVKHHRYDYRSQLRRGRKMDVLARRLTKEGVTRGG